MIDSDEIKKYLPYYLNDSAKENLYEALKQFPENIDKRLFAYREEDFVFQGDGIKDLLIVNLPKEDVVKANCIVLSNTCDIDQRNKRMFTSSVCYTPLINLNKYVARLRADKYNENKISRFVKSIKKQQVTQIFYLSCPPNLKEEYFVFLDKIVSCDNDYIDRSELNKIRLFTLSNYGFYVFLVKLSMHLTRIRENIDRDQ